MDTYENQKDKHKRDDGSPITVGGGGGDDNKIETFNISCRFKESDFPEPQGNPGKKTFKHEGWRIKTLKIVTADGIDDHSDLLPDVGNCSIEIHCSGKDDDVTINGFPFGIDMNTITYLKGINPVVHTNPNPDSFIERIDIHVPGKDQSWVFDQEDNCSVCTDHVPDSTSCPS